MLILLGVAVIVVGFADRLNPRLVVVSAALFSGWFAGLSPLQVVASSARPSTKTASSAPPTSSLPLVGVLGTRRS